MAKGKKGDKPPPPPRRLLPAEASKEVEPELTDAERKLIMRYSGPQISAMHRRILDMTPGRDVSVVETPTGEVEYRNLSLWEAWWRLNELLNERSKGPVRSYAEGLLDRPPGAKHWGAGAAIGVVGALVVGWVALPVALGVALAGSASKTRKLRAASPGTGYPDLPEFKNEWALQAYRHVQQMRGFNVRVQAIDRLREFRLMPVTSEWYARLLFGARERLCRNTGTLMHLQPEVYRGKRVRARSTDVLASDEQNRILRQLLPIWDPDLDWLPLDDGIIHPGLEFERLRDDLMLLESLREAADTARRDDRDEEWAEAIRKARENQPKDDDDEDE